MVRSYSNLLYAESQHLNMHFCNIFTNSINKKQILAIVNEFN